MLTVILLVCPSVSFLALAYTSFCGAVISARPLWLKTVRVASTPFYGVSMRLRVHHGILGETALTIEVLEQTTLGWGYYETDGDGA